MPCAWSCSRWTETPCEKIYSENSCTDRVTAFVKTPTYSDSELPFRNWIIANRIRPESGLRRRHFTSRNKRSRKSRSTIYNLHFPTKIRDPRRSILSDQQRYDAPTHSGHRCKPGSLCFPLYFICTNFIEYDGNRTSWIWSFSKYTYFPVSQWVFFLICQTFFAVSSTDRPHHRRLSVPTDNLICKTLAMSTLFPDHGSFVVCWVLRQPFTSLISAVSLPGPVLFYGMNGIDVIGNFPASSIPLALYDKYHCRIPRRTTII